MTGFKSRVGSYVFVYDSSCLKLHDYKFLNAVETPGYAIGRRKRDLAYAELTAKRDELDECRRQMGCEAVSLPMGQF